MVAERGEGENPLPFSLTAPKRGGGWGEGGLRFPPGPHLRSSRFSRHPRLRQAPTRRFAKNRNLRGLVWGKRPQAAGGPGPKPWGPGDLAHRPLAWIPPLSPVDFLQTEFLTSQTRFPGLKTLGCYHNPQSADLGGRWMVSEGGALRGSRLRSSISAAEAPKNLANKPLSPASWQPCRVTNSKNAPVLIGS